MSCDNGTLAELVQKSSLTESYFGKPFTITTNYYTKI